MNGILHVCTHPNEHDFSKQLSEKDMVMGASERWLAQTPPGSC